MRLHHAWTAFLTLFTASCSLEPSDIPIAITNDSGREVVAIEVDGSSDDGSFKQTFFFDGLAAGTTKTVQIQGLGDMNCALLVRFPDGDFIHSHSTYVISYRAGLKVTIHEDWVEIRSPFEWD